MSHRDVANASKVSLPPSEYTGTYNGLIIERVLPLIDVIRECRAPAKTLFFGCARMSQPDHGIFCVIVVPSADSYITSRIQELIRQHEIGHCLGWPADHPGARWEDSPQPKQQLHPQPSKLVWSLAPQSPLRQPPAATPPSVGSFFSKRREALASDTTARRSGASRRSRWPLVTARSRHPSRH